MGSIGLGIWLLFKEDASVSELSRITAYSKSEIIFLKEQGFLDEFKTREAPKNKEEALSLIKPATLIEQNLNSPEESFEVLVTKLDLGQNSYQMAFKLENKSAEQKEFYLIPISDQSQLKFEEITGNIKELGSFSKTNRDASEKPLAQLYDIENHKKELKPELAKAYDDIANNNYQPSPIKIIVNPQSTFLGQSKWQIVRGPTSGTLKPVYLLVYGSAGGAKDKFGVGDPQAYEFLVRVEDKLTSKAGDCITLKPAGWDWGSMERQHFAIFKIEDITYEQAQEWCSFEEEELTVYTKEGKEKKYNSKKYEFDLKDMPEDKKNDWKNQDKEVGPTIFDKVKIKSKKDKDKQ